VLKEFRCNAEADFFMCVGAEFDVTLDCISGRRIGTLLDIVRENPDIIPFKGATFHSSSGPL